MALMDELIARHVEVLRLEVEKHLQDHDRRIAGLQFALQILFNDVFRGALSSEKGRIKDLVASHVTAIRASADPGDESYCEVVARMIEASLMFFGDVPDSGAPKMSGWPQLTLIPGGKDDADK